MGRAAVAPEQEALIASNRNKPLLATWRMLMVLVFIEAIRLYGLIVALFLASN
jgi:F0F1-type ATP synthase membrane subunit c/vacuolar-type H+-ATPase subunit K